MAVDRVADDGKGTNQILAVESARVDPSAQTGCPRQTTLAHRARLRRIEAGTWPWTLRRQELTRVSSPCNVIDRRLRLPGSGAVPFPLSGNSRPLEAANIQLHIPPVPSDYTPRGATRTDRTA